MNFSRLAILLQGTAVLMLLSLSVPDVRADILPIGDPHQLQSLKLAIPGCIVSGSYDATSLIWRQSDSFDDCGFLPTIRGPGGTLVTLEDFEARLLGRVDHDGNVLSGTFMAFGAIPALGIGERTLLMRGSLLEAYYGPPFEGRSGIGINALVELDSALPVFGNPGDILLWLSYVTVGKWNYTPGPPPSSLAWQTSLTEDEYHPYTHDDYWIYDRSGFFAPEPAMLGMLVIGILGFGVAWRSRTRAA